MFKGHKIVLVAAAYNEKGKIGNVVRKAKKYAPYLDEIVVVNDHSSDSTEKEARAAGATVINHKTNMGAGAAYRTGYLYGLKNGFDIIVEIAGDDQDDPRYIKKLLILIIDKGYDYVQGSRYMYGKKLDLPGFRHFTTRAYSFVFSLSARRWVTDASNGFRAFRAKVLKNIDLNKDWLNRYEMEPYFLLNVIKKGYKFKETGVPKYWPEGKSYSKMVPFKSWWSISRPMFYNLVGIKK